MSTKKNTATAQSNKVENVITNVITETTPQEVKNIASATKGAKAGPLFMFNKKNYTFMLAGLALIAIGFILMSGGKSADPNVFNAKELYSFRRITLAPILVMAGFILEIFAIMRIPKEGEA
jgi:hypothetical protein